MQITDSSSSFIDSLNLVILAQLTEGRPDVTLIAKALGMSTRSLQRQLAQQHINYSLLVDQVRLNQTIHLLQDPDLKLIDIAVRLGYEDHANFTRAFRRWTGISPSQYRHLYSKTNQQLQT